MSSSRSRQAAELNVKNRTIFKGDNIDVLRGFNSECVDLIYLDPPFNSNRNYAAPVGSQAAGAVFKDIWTLNDVSEQARKQITETHPDINSIAVIAGKAAGSSMEAYVLMMGIRLVELHRVLKATGSLYLHCDPTASHYLKLVLDRVFGRNNFRNEIVWCYTGPGSPNMRQFNRKHDTLFWYSKGETWTFNGEAVRLPYKDPKQRPRQVFDTGGHFSQDYIQEMRSRGKIPETWWTDIAIAPRSKTEYVGYPTQKPVKLLERIIKASSNPGDVVLDPFCGCATTAVVAEKHDRQWIGIDISVKAQELVKRRLLELYNKPMLPVDIITREDKPQRTDLGHLPDYREWRDLLYGEQGGNCKLCGVHFIKGNMQVDHIIPRSDGGTDHKSNLQLICQDCHNRKSGKEASVRAGKRRAREG